MTLSSILTAIGIVLSISSLVLILERLTLARLHTAVLGSTNSILAGSIISIEMDTLDNASDDVKDLFMSLLKSKCIYPILRDQKVQWKLGVDIPMSIIDLNNAIILISNSLNSNVGNSLFNNTTRRS